MKFLNGYNLATSKMNFLELLLHMLYVVGWGDDGYSTGT